MNAALFLIVLIAIVQGKNKKKPLSPQTLCARELEAALFVPPSSPYTYLKKLSNEIALLTSPFDNVFLSPQARSIFQSYANTYQMIIKVQPDFGDKAVLYKPFLPPKIGVEQTRGSLIARTFLNEVGFLYYSEDPEYRTAQHVYGADGTGFTFILKYDPTHIFSPCPY